MARTVLPPLTKNLVLIGGRGSGKSSISRRLQRRDKRFGLLSMDLLIRYECAGKSIPEIVEERGWPGFRDVEFEVATKVGNIPAGALIDAGGGAIVDLDAEGNEVYSERKVAALKKNSLVIYLERDPQKLLERIAGDPNRPSLSDSEGFLEIMARRDPWYRAFADHVLVCGDKRRNALAEEIHAWFLERAQA